MGGPFFGFLLRCLIHQGQNLFGQLPVGRNFAAKDVDQFSVSRLILCLEGVGAMAVGALFYAEARGLFDLIAVVLIVTGIALAQRHMAR